MVSVPASRGRRSWILRCAAGACLARTEQVFAESTCRPFIEEDRTGAYATFRAHTDAFVHCPVSEATYQTVVAAWLRDRRADAPPVETLALGRAIAFPWVSAQIVDAALAQAGWAERVTAARGAAREELAAAVFRDRALVGRLGMPFRGSPYAVARISFEKVSFARADEVSSHRAAGPTLVPFDAQLWLRLERR